MDISISVNADHTGQNCVHCALHFRVNYCQADRDPAADDLLHSVGDVYTLIGIHANHYHFVIIFMLFNSNYAIMIIIAILCFLLNIELLVF